MKKTLKSVALASTLCGGLLHASWEFRTPLSAQWRGYFHWQLSSVADAWWYDSMPTQKENTTWDFHAWGVGYTRTASKAFWNNNNSDTRCTTSLAALIFGESVFRGEEAFAGGTFTTATVADQALMSNTNPYLGFARIMPLFDYNEQGAFMGIEFSRNFGSEDQWHVGGRLNIPYKVIEIEQDSDYTLEETLSDVFISRPLNDTPGANTDYAVRFDFLNSLVTSSVAIPSGTPVTTPIVAYPADNQTLTITGVNVMGTDASTTPAAYATVSVSGDVPSVPFIRLPDQVVGSLGADGQGTNEQTYFFLQGNAYGQQLAKDREKQGMLFIVPQGVANTSGQIDAIATAQTLYTNLTDLISQELLVSQTASQFFLNNSIDLAGYSRNAGIGDLFAEVYGGYGDKQNWFFDGLLGVSLPTGNRQKTSNDLYWKSTGNNGHVEIKLGLDTGWMPCNWFAFEIDAAYHHAFKRSEKRAATFTGATIVNLGPELEASVSWNYFVLRTDLNFFHPHNPDLGFTFGYELFAKGHDKVSFECDATTATDLLGRTNQPLAACNYEKRTNALSNKLRGQIFNRWNFFEVFAGGSQIVAGRDVMKETEGHVGFIAYF